jgi:hypothetical protein
VKHLGERLTAFVDGELSHAERDRVLAHLAVCPHCRAEADKLRGLKRRLNALTDGTPGGELIRRLQALGEPGDPMPPRARPLPGTARARRAGPWPFGAARTAGWLTSGPSPAPPHRSANGSSAATPTPTPTPETVESGSPSAAPTAETVEGGSPGAAPTAETVDGGSLGAAPTAETVDGGSLGTAPTAETVDGGSLGTAPTQPMNWSARGRRGRRPADPRPAGSRPAGSRPTDNRPAARSVPDTATPRRPRRRYVVAGAVSLAVLGIGTASFAAGADSAPLPRVTPAIERFAVEHALISGDVPLTDPVPSPAQGKNP